MGSLINLAKDAKIVLEKKEIFGQKANVVLVMDISLSMGELYRNGTVQELVDRMLGIGMNMDTDKSIDVFAFGRKDYEIAIANENNHKDYVNKVLLNKVRLEGYTYYAGVMNRIVQKFGNPVSVVEKKQGFFKSLFGSKKTEEAQEKVDVPTFVFFITDGDNFDKAEAESVIRNASDQAIFWQFVGIGSNKFSFLKRLDKIEDRFIDNANFFSVPDLRAVTDKDLYNKLLNEFPQWVKLAREKGILN